VTLTKQAVVVVVLVVAVLFGYAVFVTFMAHKWRRLAEGFHVLVRERDERLKRLGSAFDRAAIVAFVTARADIPYEVKRQLAEQFVQDHDISGTINVQTVVEAPAPTRPM